MDTKKYEVFEKTVELSSLTKAAEELGLTQSGVSHIIAALEEECDRVTAAKAADELLNIMGIDTSFVIAPEGDKVNLSARSMGDTNVQVILEKLGGGGNAAAAGGQVSGKSVDEVAQELKEAIDQYFEK